MNQVSQRPLGASYIKTARSILENRELALGHTVVEVEVEGLSEGVAYLLKTKGLATKQVEFLALLDGSPTNKDLDIINAAAEKFGTTSHPICVAPKGEMDQIAQAKAVGVSLWEPEELFSRFVALPARFPSLLRDVAALQRTNAFFDTFQERDAVVDGVSWEEEGSKTVGATSYLLEWLSARKRTKPILLLGERGTGKSWQMLRFAQEAHARSLGYPWQSGLVFFVRLSELVNLIEEASAATPVLPQYIIQKYPDVQFAFDGAGMLGALLRSGHSVVCVDGFDEMDLLPTDTQVRARLTGLLLLLSKSTRFVLTCRPGHFDSLTTLLAANTWGVANIGETFEILELVPFDLSRKLAYINAAAEPGKGKALLDQLAGLKEQSIELQPLQNAVSTCAQHPGFLAYLVEAVKNGEPSATRLIGDGIKDVFIEFNMLHARTLRTYRSIGGKRVDLSSERRMQLLSDIAWYMAERELPNREATIDLANLPPRIRLHYNIDSDVLERDLRSQTVFELVPTTSEIRADNDTDPEIRDIRYTERLESMTSERVDSQMMRTSLARFTLRTPKKATHATGVKLGESSVCGGYFLANHIAARLRQTGPFGPLSDEVRLRHLGRVGLGPQAAALLRELLHENDPDSISRLGVDGWQMMRKLASDSPFYIYSPWFRYLAANLCAIGSLSPAAALAVDPWSEQVSLIIAPPFRLNNYQMALVPPPKSSASAKPFLLGVHEVTNEQYLHFLKADSSVVDSNATVWGKEWTVNRVTIAGSGSTTPPSPNSTLTNEYHLFLWMPNDATSVSGTHEDTPPFLSYLPPEGIRRHPVTYVSWYAAASYCDWLSNGERLALKYADVLANPPRVNDTTRSNEINGYRLPTKEEWIWAARAGHEDIHQPWDLFPYYLPEQFRDASTEQKGFIVNPDAWQYYQTAQQVMHQVLLGAGKDRTDVVYDEPNDFGVSGLMGNVREWCHDAPVEQEGLRSNPSIERLILGSTGYLGLATFDFEYATPLYPRNTNPDVGFRVARSPSADELKLLNERQAEIAALPEHPTC
jgi:formylglycine-generating enzyme required for sulfatase activity